ncbi:MAG TPA: hypothetical protein VJ044_06875 [Candidatus Hodarchaeales archaeon]|nr:hypothetical protein [Candidatus Hodarchaeales archaeon]
MDIKPGDYVYAKVYVSLEEKDDKDQVYYNVKGGKDDWMTIRIKPDQILNVKIVSDISAAVTHQSAA